MEKVGRRPAGLDGTERDVGQPRQQRQPIEDERHADVRGGAPAIVSVGVRSGALRRRRATTRRPRRPRPARSPAGSFRIDVGREDPRKVGHRAIPVHARLTTVSTAFSLAVAGCCAARIAFDLRLDGYEPRLIGGQLVPLAVNDRAPVDEERRPGARQGRSRPRHRSAGSPCRKVAAERCKRALRELASAGRRLTARISAPPPVRSRRRARPGRLARRSRRCRPGRRERIGDAHAGTHEPLELLDEARHAASCRR